MPLSRLRSSALLLALLALAALPAAALQDQVVSRTITLSEREATLEVELASGKAVALSLRGGIVFLDGDNAGRYQPGGALDRSWRRLLADAASLETGELLVAIRAWRPPAVSAGDRAARTRLEAALRALALADARTAPAVARADTAGRAAAPEAEPRGVSITLLDLESLDAIERQLAALEDVGADVAAAVRESPMHLGDYAVAAGERVDGNVVVFKGNADIHGEVSGSVVALYGDVAYHRGALIGGSAVSVGGAVNDLGGTVRGDIKSVSPDDLAPVDVSDVRVRVDADVEADSPRAWEGLFRDVQTVVAVFIALAMMGFGAVFFGRRYLEVVADTASHSFGRSLVVGVLGQLLLLPTFAMLVVGLVFTIVGILVLPFAAVAYAVAACLAVILGYLAVAHSVGETFTRRRMAHGAFVRAPNAYGYLFTGLVGLLGLWALAALFGWAGPVVVLLRIVAAIVTWLAGTVGFGAVLLSRGGLRETFTGRHFAELSDEYLWATPPATPTAARMGRRQ
jgi:MFS family permease